MKSRSPKFPQIPTNHQLTAKTATGNGNLQPEIVTSTRVLAAALVILSSAVPTDLTPPHPAAAFSKNETYQCYPGSAICITQVV